MSKNKNEQTLYQLTSYWQLYQVRSHGIEYIKDIEIAEKWIKNELKLYRLTQIKILNHLLDNFKNENLDDLTEKGKAGLCLRCYISEHIVTACKKRASLFSRSQGVTYQALLPFVLDDDGKSLIIVDQETKQQLEITENEELVPKTHNIFTVEVLRTYKNNSEKKKSLINWTYLKTKQNKKIVEFLSEFGFSGSTDWSLLNEIEKYKLKRMSQQEQSIVRVYHEVYRENRRQNQLRNKCQEPSDEQLQEMIKKLKIKTINTPDNLLNQLKCIAKQMRQFLVSLDKEFMYQEGDIKTREIAYHDSSLEDKEDSEIIDYINNNMVDFFAIYIEKGVKNQIEKLRKSKNNSRYASQYMSILKEFYQEGKSISNLAKGLGIKQYQASRIFSPKNLLTEVRKQTVDDLNNSTLELLKRKKIISDPIKKDYLITLTKSIEEFVDQKIFTEASAEIMSGKDKKNESFYSKNLINYLNQNS